jgi:biopolymer transport protein TolR
MTKLSRVQRRYVERQVEKRKDSELALGELNVVPFLDIVVNLIMFLLVSTTTVLAVTEVDAQLPTQRTGSCATGCRAPEELLGLTLTLTGDGIVVSGRGGTLGPGCDGVVAGATTVPMRTTGYDFRSLTACLTRVKQRFPDEHDVTVTANPTVPYESLVAVMDAARSDGSRSLFPDVHLAAGLR